MSPKTISDHLFDHAREQLGYAEPINMPLYEEMQKTQWCYEFEHHMRVRLLMGALRYGLNFVKAPGKPKYRNTDSIIERLNLYKKDHNAEHLIDAANLCMIEFAEGDAKIIAQCDSQHVETV